MEEGSQVFEAADDENEESEVDILVVKNIKGPGIRGKESSVYKERVTNIHLHLAEARKSSV